MPQLVGPPALLQVKNRAVASLSPEASLRLRRAYTLVELIVVIVIMVLLAGLVIGGLIKLIGVVRSFKG